MVEQCHLSMLHCVPLDFEVALEFQIEHIYMIQQYKFVAIYNMTIVNIVDSIFSLSFVTLFHPPN